MKERNMSFIVYLCTVHWDCFLHKPLCEQIWGQDTGSGVVQPQEHLRIKRLVQELKSGSLVMLGLDL